MKRIFGRKAPKKEEPPPPSISEVSGRVDGRLGTLNEKINKLDRQLVDLKGKMKRSRGAAKNRYKKQALQVLKRKKMYEGQRNNLEAQGFNLEQTSFAIETAQDTKDSVAALKQSTVALKAAFKEINIDEVEDIQDEMDDIMMDQEEIQEVMGRAFGNVEDVDEDELMEELDGLEDELEMEDELGVAGDVPSYLADEMPGAPSGPIAATPATEQLDEFGLPVAPVAMQ